MRPKWIWVGVAVASASIAALSVVLTEWLALEACHLCVFQRFLFMVLALLALGAALSRLALLERLLGLLAALVAMAGTLSAAYQSWLQHQGTDSLLSCSGSVEPNLVERLVEWLGQQSPLLFMPSGFCDDPGLTLVGLSLANWAMIGFSLGLLAALWALWRGRT